MGGGTGWTRTGNKLRVTTLADSVIIGASVGFRKFTVNGDMDVNDNAYFTDTVFWNTNNAWITYSGDNMKLGDLNNPSGVSLTSLTQGGIFSLGSLGGTYWYYLDQPTYNMHLGAITPTNYKLKVTGDINLTGSVLVDGDLNFNSGAGSYTSYYVASGSSQDGFKFYITGDSIKFTELDYTMPTQYSQIETDMLKLTGSNLIPQDNSLGKLRVTVSDSALWFCRGTSWSNILEGAGIVNDTISNTNLVVESLTHFDDTIYVNYMNLAAGDTVALISYGITEVVDSASLVPAAKAWTDKLEPFEVFYAKSKELKSLPLPYPNGTERRKPNAKYMAYQFEYELERNIRYDKELRDRVTELEKENNYLRKRPNKKVINELLLRMESLEKRVDYLERKVTNHE
jgi:hypothetical protein